MCSREIKGLAAVQYTGFNDCEILTLLRSTCYYCCIHFPEGEAELIWQMSEDCPKYQDFLPIGSILMENRQGGLSILTEKDYRNKYIACC
jgi:hypothetical protein